MSENEVEIVLSETGRMVIEDILAATEIHRLYARDEKACEEAFRAICRRLLDDAPMAVAERNKYRWFVREAARLLRSRTGGDLADGYNMLLVKWKGLGLRLARMELLLGALWNSVRPTDDGGA